MSHPNNLQRMERLEQRLFLSTTGDPASQSLTVMTQNLYLGCDVEKLKSIASLDELPIVTAQAWSTVQQTDFPTRAQILANEVAQAQPDLLGLQEAALWRVQEQSDFFAGNATLATDVKYDFVQTLVDDLAARGLTYAPVAQVEGMDIELPAVNAGGGLSDIRLTDRDVILARADLPKSRLKLDHAQGAQFVAKQTITVGPITAAIARGWTSVDATVNGKTFHVVESHTETFSQEVQLAQIQELRDGPMTSALPTIVMGDFNAAAAAQDDAYKLLVSGFGDSWTWLGGEDPGLTWGHNETLTDDGSGFTQRLDLVLYGPNVLPNSIDLWDEPVSPATSDGPLWASDHAGISTSFDFIKHPGGKKTIHKKTVEFSAAELGDRAFVASL